MENIKINNHYLISFFICLISFNAYTSSDRSLSSEGAELYFIQPKEGQILESPIRVKFGLRGMGVAPAGVDISGTGHHHLLVDVEELPPLDEPIISDSNHIHFGGGQTEVLLELSPGNHKLQLLLGDKYHIPHLPPIISKEISIIIK